METFIIMMIITIVVVISIIVMPILFFREPICIQSTVLYSCASRRARVGVQRGLWNLASIPLPPIEK